MKEHKSKFRGITINIEACVGVVQLNKYEYDLIKKFKKSNSFFNIKRLDYDYKEYTISKDSFSGNYGLNLIKSDKCLTIDRNMNNSIDFLNRIVKKIIDIENNNIVEKTINFN